MKKLCFLLCVVLFSIQAWAGGQLKIITLQHRFAQDLLPSIQPLVGADGTASAIGDHLLIRTTPDRLLEIEQVISTLDIERKTLRITVSRDRSHQDMTRGIGVTGSIRQGDVVVRMPDRAGRAGQGLAIEMGQRDSVADEHASEFVSVLEGERASIAVGQSVPFTVTWATYFRNYAHIQESVQYRDITTGFSVRPRVIRDAYEIEITPRVSTLSGGVIFFEELSTTVRVRHGEWFNLGGVMQARDEVSREILSGGTVSSSRQSQLWINVQ